MGALGAYPALQGAIASFRKIKSSNTPKVRYNSQFSTNCTHSSRFSSLHPISSHSPLLIPRASRWEQARDSSLTWSKLLQEAKSTPRKALGSISRVKWRIKTKLLGKTLMPLVTLLLIGIWSIERNKATGTFDLTTRGSSSEQVLYLECVYNNVWYLQKTFLNDTSIYICFVCAQVLSDSVCFRSTHEAGALGRIKASIMPPSYDTLGNSSCNW